MSPLLAPFLAAVPVIAVLWRLGFRGVAVVLPLALALGWLTLQGHGARPDVTIGAGVLAGATFLLALGRLGPPAPDRSMEAPAETVGPRGRLVPHPARAYPPRRIPSAAPEVLATEVPAAEGPAAGPDQDSAEGAPGIWRRMLEDRSEGSAARPTSASATALLQREGPSRGRSPSQVPAPVGPRGTNGHGPRGEERTPAASPTFVRRTTLLEAIRSAATVAQKATLVGELDDPAERLHLLRTPFGAAAPIRTASKASVGRARTAARRRWGPDSPTGMLVGFEGIAPGNTTVLAVLVEVETPAGEHQGRAVVLVPTDLHSVKRLDPASEPRARWVARGAFVTLHHVVGEGRGIGQGDAILEPSN